jgi:LEA14-like dessication related protein
LDAVKLASMDNILIFGGLIIAFIFFGGAQTVNSLKFVATGVGFDVSNLLSPIINVTVIVQNPTSTALQLNSFAGTATVNGTASGNVSYFQPVLIAANSQTTITLQIRLSDAGIISDLMNFISAGTGQLLVAVNGTANINGAGLPVSLSMNASV